MKAMGLAWGAAFVIVLSGATAQAATKAAAAPASGTAGAAAAPATTPPLPAPSSAAPGSATPGAAEPAAPPAAAQPIAPDAAVAPGPAAPPDIEANGDDDEEEEDDRPRRKRKRKRHKPMDWDQPQEEPEALPAPVAQPWRLVGSHFILSAERLTNVLAWSTTQKVEVPTDNFNSFPDTTSVEIQRSGLDVSFLGATGSNNAFGLPRVGFDGMFSNGLTLGGSLSYVVTSSKHDTVQSGSNNTSVDDPSVSYFVFAPRVGVMFAATPSVGIWLRGGITRISASSEATNTDPNTNTTSTSTSTLTLVDVTLDPQIVISPVPHVGITLGVPIDIGLSGSVETAGSSQNPDILASSYGVSAGLAAIF